MKSSTQKVGLFLILLGRFSPHADAFALGHPSRQLQVQLLPPPMVSCSGSRMVGLSRPSWVLVVPCAAMIP